MIMPQRRIWKMSTATLTIIDGKVLESADRYQKARSQPHSLELAG
jgi:hypothetical protein